MFANVLLLLTAVASTTTATPLKRSTITAADLISVAPTTANCDGAPFPSECRPATIAAPALQLSFNTYGISSFNTQAALVALVLYESGSFKYSMNHYPAPGTPGQGTRNMMSPTYVEKYATWLATNRPQSAVTMQKIQDAKAQGPAAVLLLVNSEPELGFGSAGWFLTTQCEAGVSSALAAGTQEGWSEYITSCVGTTLTDDRTAIYEKVMALEGW